MRISKPIIYVGGIVVVVVVSAVSGVFGFPVDTPLISGAIIAISALANPAGE